MIVAEGSIDEPIGLLYKKDLLRDVVEGGTSLAAARESILIETRQYAKRQRTWFRHQLTGSNVSIVDPHDPDAHDVVERWWRGGLQR